LEPGLLGGQRAAFNVPAEIAYFNTANLAPQLRAVRIAGEAPPAIWRLNPASVSSC
jgi:hypothetical protein